jgi:hypothetical protein
VDIRTKHRIIVVAAIALIAAYVVSIIPNIRHRSEMQRVTIALQALPFERLTRATETFSRDRGTNSSVVSLRDLISGGYLRAQEVGVLRDREVAIALARDDSNPTAVLVRVKLLTGRNDVVLLGDGSIRVLAVTK